MTEPTEQVATENRHRRRTLEQWLFHRLSTEAGGNDSVPCEWINGPGSGGSPIVHVNEDAFTLWIGTVDEWHTSFSRTEARRLAVWILFRWWAWGEWFGLRRALWFWLLRRRLR